MRHHLSVDLEDWYLDVAGAAVDPPAAARALDRQLAALRAILAGAGVRATFFVLGATAERHPAHVARLHADGHEIAAHGHAHRRIDGLDVRTLARDVERAAAALAAITGVRPIGYRAPYFSLPRDPRAAAAVHAVLAAAGYRYSSSTRGEASRRAFAAGGAIREIPTAALALGPFTVPVGGGGYWRVLPRAAIVAAISRDERAGRAFAAYLHPHELDDEPLRAGRPVRDAIANLGRATVADKLRRVLADFRFGPYRDALAEAG